MNLEELAQRIEREGPGRMLLTHIRKTLAGWFLTVAIWCDFDVVILFVERAAAIRARMSTAALRARSKNDG